MPIVRASRMRIRTKPESIRTESANGSDPGANVVTYSAYWA